MPADVVKFGDGLELDRNSYELRRVGRALKLERIPLDILFLLVERRGQLVSRDDIIAKIWGEDVFLDTDSSINGAIRKIRMALKDDPENPVFVQTVTGKGYRFIAAVTEAEIPAQEGGDKKPESSKAISEERPARLATRQERLVSLAPRLWVASLVALLGVAVLAAGIYGLRTRSRSVPASEHRVMLAVLPFANLSNDPEQEYFSDGLTEETITSFTHGLATLAIPKRYAVRPSESEGADVLHLSFMPEDGILCTVREGCRTTHRAVPIDEEWLAERSTIQRA